MDKSKLGLNSIQGHNINGAENEKKKHTKIICNFL